MSLARKLYLSWEIKCCLARIHPQTRTYAVRDFFKKICKKKFTEQSSKAGIFVSNRSPTTFTYCGNRGKWENQLNIWRWQWWIFLKLRYASDSHLNFIVWKNHWNATARFWVIKDFKYHLLKVSAGEHCIKLSFNWCINSDFMTKQYINVWL